MSVLSVSLSSTHKFHKTPVSQINLLANLGVEGDCHNGVTVQHRSRLHIRPPPLNLRQVHLIHSELFTEFEAQQDGKEFHVEPGQLGENISTFGIDLLALSTSTLLHFLNERVEMQDEHAVVKLTGVRNPCPQIDAFQEGLKERCLLRDGERKIVGRKAGVMGIVEAGGLVQKGARIVVEQPDNFVVLECV